MAMARQNVGAVPVMNVVKAKWDYLNSLTPSQREEWDLQWMKLTYLKHVRLEAERKKPDILQQINLQKLKEHIENCELRKKGKEEHVKNPDNVSFMETLSKLSNKIEECLNVWKNAGVDHLGIKDSVDNTSAKIVVEGKEKEIVQAVIQNLENMKEMEKMLSILRSANSSVGREGLLRREKCKFNTRREKLAPYWKGDSTGSGGDNLGGKLPIWGTRINKTKMDLSSGEGSNPFAFTPQNFEANGYGSAVAAVGVPKINKEFKGLPIDCRHCFQMHQRGMCPKFKN